jgi:hypothetical protein
MVSPVRQKSRWPWLLALLVVTIGISFAAVIGVIAWMKTRVPALVTAVPLDASAKTSAPTVQSAAPITSVANAPVVSAVASTTATHVAAHTTAAAPQPTAASTRTPPPTFPIGAPVPPSLGKTPMSGTHINSTGFDGEDCNETPRAMIDDMKAKAAACFTQFQFQPPVHESAEYIFWIDAASNMNRVERMATSPDVPNFHVCMAAAIRTAPVPKTMKSCWARISFGAPCKPDWPGQCLADAGP